MAHQVEKDGIKNILFVEGTSIVKEEQSEEADFIDDTVHISHSNVNMENMDLKDDIGLINKIRQHEVTPISDIKTEFSSPELKYDIVKIENGISGTNIKVECTKGQLYCENCHAHYDDYCINCGMLLHILNKNVPSGSDDEAEEQLPSDILGIKESFCGLGIFALKVIPERVKFGPFTGISGLDCPLKIKGGKFVVTKDSSKCLNWMQYINFARNFSEQNLLALQHENNIYYESTRQILVGDELLVHFGEVYEGSLNNEFEMDFIPTVKYTIMDVFACTFCCFGFSSEAHLAKHKTICLASAAEEFLIKELIQCPSCKIHLDREEYFQHHAAYCSERKCIPPTTRDRTAQVSVRKAQPRQMFKCQQCKYRTKYKGDLKNHTNQHHEVKMYKCTICFRRFQTKEVLTLHLENIHPCADAKDHLEHSTGIHTKTHVKAEHSHSQNEPEQLKCSMCEFRTKYKTSLKRHTAEKHLNVFKYKCDICDYKTNRKSQLKSHINTKHLQEFKYKCDSCDYKSNKKSNLTSHIEVRHLPDFKYKCDRCDYKANQKSQLDSHIQTRHLKVFRYSCDSCDYKANSKAHMNTHVKVKHLKEFNYKCDICDYKANLKSKLKIHLETRHLKEFNYKCDACDYETNQKSRLKYHIKARHLKEFKYKCDTCDFKSNWMSHFKIHLETKHCKEFKYKCDTCDYRINLKSQLQYHIERRHLQEFKYKCDRCDYKANQKSQLKYHVEARHLQEFKYKCESCDYKTTRKATLKIHVERIHLREFKYKCDTCDYKAGTKMSLSVHVKSKHLKEFSYKCETCEYKTNIMSNLKKHVKAKHP